MTTADLARTIREEQAALERVLDDLRRETAVIPRQHIAPWIERIRGRFEHFRAHMVKHMALEEDEGYLAPVLHKRPALTETVERLQHEHGELLRLMNDMHAVLQEAGPHDRLVVRDFCERARCLLAYIEHHEYEENLLLLDGVTRDFGTKD